MLFQYELSNGASSFPIIVKAENIQKADEKMEQIISGEIYKYKFIKEVNYENKERIA